LPSLPLFTSTPLSLYSLPSVGSVEREDTGEYNEDRGEATDSGPSFLPSLLSFPIFPLAFTSVFLSFTCFLLSLLSYQIHTHAHIHTHIILPSLTPSFKQGTAAKTRKSGRKTTPYDPYMKPGSRPVASYF